MRYKVRINQLHNKVRVLEIPVDGAESVVSMVLVKTGSRNEPDEKLGISHVLEHMVFKGTKKYPTPLTLAATVDAMGAEFNAFTGKEYTGFYIKSAADYLEKSLDVLSEMMINPLLKASDLEREKGVIIEEINMYQDQPRERVMEEFENLMFEGSNLGRLIIGTPKTVQGMKIRDLKAYKQEWYKGENVVVVVAGKIKKSVKDLIEEYFGGMGSGTIKPFVDEGKYGKTTKKVIEKKTEQTHFVVGVPGLDLQDEKRTMEAVLRVVLGGNMSSRLFVEVREKRGLAYYVGAVAEHYFDVGFLGARAGVKKEAFDMALEVIKDQMFNLNKDIKAEEVKRAKQYLLGKMVLGLEDPMGWVRWFGPRFLMGLDLETPEAVMEKIKKITTGQVRDLAKELFSEKKLRVAVVK